MELGLTGRAALVCGASRGLGRACAEALAAEGVKVALVARREGAVGEAASAIARAHGVETLGIVADLAAEDACERAVREAEAGFGQVDILVANAGGPPAGFIDELDDAAWRRAFELTFLTTVRLGRAALPAMAGRGWGRMVVIGSGSMATPIPNLATSSGLRPGLKGVVKLFAERYAKDGVTVNTVAPGYFRTERLIEVAHGSKEEGTSGPGAMQLFRRLAAEIPVGRLGEPEELGAMVAFLASDRAAYVTGQTVLLDGGRNHGL
ncbi:MAG: SDR family oxidoreductase [Candidatus Eisenbacteria bacterium]